MSRQAARHAAGVLQDAIRAGWLGSGDLAWEAMVLVRWVEQELGGEMQGRYVSIDIETTGTDWESCQVLEFAAVVETDWATPVEQLPALHLLVRQEFIRGQPAALVMNARLITELAIRLEAKVVTEREPPMVSPGRLPGVLFDFLARHFPAGERKVVVAGKNFAGFDLRFLEKLPNWDRVADRFCHRVHDPAGLWFDPATDAKPPATGVCLGRAGLPVEEQHHALTDARNVIRLMRAGYAARAAKRAA